MSEQGEELLRFIASTVEHLREQMATKDDLAELRREMATKTELAELRREMATKTELAELRREMATKTELAELRREMATKTELAELQREMATKAEMAGGFARLELRMDSGLTAVRGDLERVNLRLDSLDRAIGLRFSHVEADIGRLRSAVYLLAKNRPEILRVLGPASGYSPPSGAEHEPS